MPTLSWAEGEKVPIEITKAIEKFPIYVQNQTKFYAIAVQIGNFSFRFSEFTLVETRFQLLTWQSTFYRTLCERILVVFIRISRKMSNLRFLHIFHTPISKNRLDVRISFALVYFVDESLYSSASIY